MSKPALGSMFETDFFKTMDFSKVMADYKIPGFNFEPLLAIQRKNIEAMTALNQAAFDSFQSLAQRHTETMRQSYEDGMRMMNNMMSAPNPQDKVMMQAEASKAAVEKCMENAREVSEALTRYNTQALQTVSTRISETLEELRGVVSNDTRNAA